MLDLDKTGGILLHHHHPLFKSKTLESRLKSNYDQAQCWLCSFDEAREVVALHDSIQRENSSAFFGTTSDVSSSCSPSHYRSATIETSLSGSLSNDSDSITSWHTISSTTTMSNTSTSQSVSSESLPLSVLSWSTIAS
jgi:hypothetical protein